MHCVAVECEEETWGVEKKLAAASRPCGRVTHTFKKVFEAALLREELRDASGARTCCSCSLLQLRITHACGTLRRGNMLCSTARKLVAPAWVTCDVCDA